MLVLYQKVMTLFGQVKLIDHGAEQIIEFNAPANPGDYPYVCTFPGHHIIMRGNLKVTK